MSRKSEAAERADAELHALLAEQDARWQVRQEQDRARTQQILAEAKQQDAKDRLEAEAVQVENYRATAVAQATSSKTIAPQFLAFINATSKEGIDAQIEQAKYATAEIVSELVGQGEPTVQSRDEYTGQFIPQQPQVADRHLPAGMYEEEYRAAEDGSLDYATYVRMRDRIGGPARRDLGIFG